MAGEEAEDPTERIEREATTWFVRLNSPLASDNDRRSFRRWADADPAHERAFADRATLWRDLSGPASRLQREFDLAAAMPRKSRSRGLRLALAASLAVCALGGVTVWRDAGLIDRALADHATRPGERRDFTLADGSRIHLDGGGAFDVSLAPDARVVTLRRGRAWFEVEADRARPFTIDAGALGVRVVGTSFGIDRELGQVVVEHGEVMASGAGGGSVRLIDSQAARADEAGQLGRAEPVDAGQELAWRRGLIVLDAAPLGRVADELARMAPGRVLIPDAELRALRLSGVFRGDDPDAVLAAIRASFGLKTASIPGLATIVYR